MAAAGSEVRD